MKNSYFTLHLTLSTSSKLSEEMLSEVGSAAWNLLEKSLEAWPLREVEVRDEELTFKVPVLEMADFDVSMPEAPPDHEQLEYGLEFSITKAGSVLTPLHLAEVVSMSIAASREAAEADGLASVSVTLARVEAQEYSELCTCRSAPNCDSLFQLADEVHWVTSDYKSTLTGLYRSRDTAFATGARYVEAFDASGKPVRCYWRHSPVEQGRSSRFTSQDYAVES